MRVFCLFVCCLIAFSVVGQTTEGYKEHIVEKGETLFSISRKYKVSLKDIKKESEGNVVKIGEKLLIPNVAEVAVSEKLDSNKKFHIVASGETLFSISQKYKIRVEELKEMNELNSNEISTGQKLIVPVLKVSPEMTDPNVVKHIVEASETLYSLSKRYKVSVADIKKLNKMDSDALSVGDELFIRSKEVAADLAMKDTLNDIGYKEVSFEGVARKDQSPLLDKPYSYGIHRSIPVGTVVRVVNTSNGKQQYVRIMKNSSVGGLNQLTVNKTAFERLGGTDETHISVKMVYVL